MLEETFTDYLKRASKGLIYSNIYISLEAASIAITTMYLAGFSYEYAPILISFSAFYLIYNIDRFTDTEEDEKNMPKRTRFVKKYGAHFVASSILTYIVALFLAFKANITTLILTLLPVGFGVVYSPLNLKKIFLVKNGIVGISWGLVPLIIGFYFNRPDLIAVTFLSVLFTISFFRSAMIFDIKDMEGDLKEGIKTVPNTLSIAHTKLFVYLIDISLMTVEIFLITKGYLSTEFLVLLPFHLYILLYTTLLNKERGEYFYSVVIDGECIFLAILVLIMNIAGV